APPVAAPQEGQHFGGKIASLTLLRRALSADEIKQLNAAPRLLGCCFRGRLKALVCPDAWADRLPRTTGSGRHAARQSALLKTDAKTAASYAADPCGKQP